MPPLSDKRGLTLKQTERLETERLQAVEKHCMLSISFDRCGHCQGARGSRRRIPGHMHTDALKLRQGKKVNT